jgi:hypothetical protein
MFAKKSRAEIGWDKSRAVRLVLQELYEHLTHFPGLLAAGCMKTGGSYSFSLRLPDPVLAGTQD